MHYFQNRITHVHLHVPALSVEVAKELNLDPIKEGCSCEDLATTCFLKPGPYCCSPVLFCCCSTLLPMMPGALKGDIPKLEGYSEVDYDAADVMAKHMCKHSMAAGVH